MQQRPSTKEEYLRRVNLVIEYINDHLGEDINLNKLAEMSGFSSYHFHRIMRAFLREPIGTYIIRMRVETAARLLRYSDMSIGDIAYRIGYNVPSSLSKVFRQFYGISPNDYRNNKEHVIMKPLEINPSLNVSVEVKELAPKQVIYIRLSGEYMKLNYCEAWQRLFTYMYQENLLPDNAKEGCPPGIEFICVYHDDPKVTANENLRTDVCLTLLKPAQPKGEVGVREIPGGKYAIFRYQGPYSNLSAVYDTIYGHWLPESSYKVRDSRGFENYINNPENTRPEDLITEICIPIE